MIAIIRVGDHKIQMHMNDIITQSHVRLSFDPSRLYFVKCAWTMVMNGTGTHSLA